MEIRRNKMIEKMAKFYKEQAANAFDYNSLDIHYENGAYLKFLISPEEYLGMTVACCRIAYVDEERSLETGLFCDIATKKSVNKFIEETLDTFYGKYNINYQVGIERVYENVLQ